MTKKLEGKIAVVTDNPGTIPLIGRKRV